MNLDATTSPLRCHLSLAQYASSEHSPILALEEKALILDQTVALDAGGGEVSRVVNSREDSVILSDLLIKYHIQPSLWNQEQTDRLSSHSTQGVHLGRLNIAWGGWVKERFGIDRNEKMEWGVSAVYDDGNRIYLSVENALDEGKQKLLIGITAQKTLQVRAFLTLSNFYLLTGEWATEAEALSEVKALMPQDVKISQLEFEIWEVDTGGKEPSFVVGLPVKKKDFRKRKFEALEKKYKRQLSLRSSDRFRRRVLLVK